MAPITLRLDCDGELLLLLSAEEGSSVEAEEVVADEVEWVVCVPWELGKDDVAIVCEDLRPVVAVVVVALGAAFGDGKVTIPGPLVGRTSVATSFV